MMMNNMVQLGATLPDGSKGAILTLSQSPCNDPTNPGACCNAKGSIGRLHPVRRARAGGLLFHGAPAAPATHKARSL